MQRHLILGLILITSLVFNTEGKAQVSAKERNELINRLVIKLKENYVFPEIAELM